MLNLRNIITLIAPQKRSSICIPSSLNLLGYFLKPMDALTVNPIKVADIGQTRASMPAVTLGKNIKPLFQMSLFNHYQ